MAILDVDAAYRAGLEPLDLANAFCDGGATFLQIRAKTASSSEFLDVARVVVRIAHASGATVMVNDRADIARLAEADGVHVGQDDLSPADVRSIIGADAVVGLSTHTQAQLDVAIGEPITYVAIGPVFETRSKATGYDAVGLGAVRAAAAIARAAGLALVAIGGITLENAPSVIEAGAQSVAVIGDLLTSGDPAGRTRQFLRRLDAVEANS